MKALSNITIDPIQIHHVPLEDGDLIITLRFYPTTQVWCFDVEFNEKKVNGLKCSLGVVHSLGSNFPFDFSFGCTQNTGLDPYKIDDFESRVKFYLLEQSDVQEYRELYV